MLPFRIYWSGRLILTETEDRNILSAGKVSAQMPNARWRFTSKEEAVSLCFTPHRNWILSPGGARGNAISFPVKQQADRRATLFCGGIRLKYIPYRCVEADSKRSRLKAREIPCGEMNWLDGLFTILWFSIEILCMDKRIYSSINLRL